MMDGLEQSKDDPIIADLAWRWFEYHASQRQTVFRFFLIVIGGLAAAFFTALQSPGAMSEFIITTGISIFSFLFWRLDVRNSRLIKIAEALMQKHQSVLSMRTGYKEIELAKAANDKSESNYLLRGVSSYSQIYRVFFIVFFGLGSTASVYHALKMWVW